jgi:hypothetical protein
MYGELPRFLASTGRRSIVPKRSIDFVRETVIPLTTGIDMTMVLNHGE